MYKVVLIDDERIIVEGLKKIVKWKDYNCEVVGTAQDAESGAKLIREMSPDIVFTDIRMPDEDGLEMLGGLIADYPYMQITVLTGFRDFSYAQEAIRLGVTRFLLKPSKMDEINEALAVMTSKLSTIKPEEFPADETEDANAGSFIVNKAISFMKEKYAEKITLQDVADQCYVSSWHLSKLLNRYAESGFYDILNRIRIDRAKELLINPGYKISDICEMVGYTDTAHFSRVFKKTTGMSANEYRNTLK